MKKTLLGAVLAALAMWLFGALYWMNPLPYKFLKSTGDDVVAGQILAATFPETGTYSVPGPHQEQQESVALAKAGPVATVHIRVEGAESMSPRVFALGYLHNLMVSLLLSVLLCKVGSSLKTYGCRVGFVTMVGLTGTVLIQCSNPIWWHQPWTWALVEGFYYVLMMVVAGLVLAKFVCPRETAAPPAA